MLAHEVETQEITCAGGMPAFVAHPAGAGRHPVVILMHERYGLTSIIATHNPRLAAGCDRILRLEGGRLISATNH